MKETSLLLGSAAFALGTTMLNKMQAEGQQIGGLASWGSVTQGQQVYARIKIKNTGNVTLISPTVSFAWEESPGIWSPRSVVSPNIEPGTESGFIDISFPIGSTVPVGVKNAKASITYQGTVIAELSGTFDVVTGVAAQIISVTITV